MYLTLSTIDPHVDRVVDFERVRSEMRIRAWVLFLAGLAPMACKSAAEDPDHDAPPISAGQDAAASDPGSAGGAGGEPTGPETWLEAAEVLAVAFGTPDQLVPTGGQVQLEVTILGPDFSVKWESECGVHLDEGPLHLLWGAPDHAADCTVLGELYHQNELQKISATTLLVRTPEQIAAIEDGNLPKLEPECTVSASEPVAEGVLEIELCASGQNLHLPSISRPGLFARLSVTNKSTGPVAIPACGRTNYRIEVLVGEDAYVINCAQATTECRSNGFDLAAGDTESTGFWGLSVPAPDDPIAGECFQNTRYLPVPADGAKLEIRGSIFDEDGEPLAPTLAIPLSSVAVELPTD